MLTRNLFPRCCLCLVLVLCCWTGLPGSRRSLGEVSFFPERDTPTQRKQRDWTKYPAIVEIVTSEDVYAVGDVHGDYDRLVQLLDASKIIHKAHPRPENVHWNAGKAVLVCTGDLIDKGEESLKVIALFRALQVAAAKEGGQVIVTMGNHEAEFLTDPTNPKVKDLAAELEKAGIKPCDVAAGRDPAGIGQFLQSLPLAARVNDWFFAHAGNTQGRTLEQLKSELQEGVDARGYRVDDSFPALGALLDARLHPYPWWQASDSEQPKVSQAKLLQNVQALGVKHLVIGHQPGKVTFSDGTRRERGELFQKSGLIFLIDVGMSRKIDCSKGALLRIHRGSKVKATVIRHDGSTEKLWSE